MPRARLISPGGKGKGRVQSGQERRMVYLQLSGDAFCCLGVTRPLSGKFRRRWEPDVPAVVPVEQRSRCAIRATETEWHRNRSVATSRGAWLPGAHLYGRLRSASGKAWEAQLLDAEREREGERWKHWNSRDLALTDLCNHHPNTQSALLSAHVSPRRLYQTGWMRCCLSCSIHLLHQNPFSRNRGMSVLVWGYPALAASATAATGLHVFKNFFFFFDNI